MCTKKFLYCRPSFLITNKKLFVSQELILTPKLYLITRNLDIPGYNIIRKIMHVAVNMGEFAFILKTLPFKLISTKYLQEWITFEIKIERKCCNFICLYRSPSETNDEFEFFLKKFELTLDKIHEGSMINAVMSNYGLNRLIQDQTDILNSSSCYIDLMFTFFSFINR